MTSSPTHCRAEATTAREEPWRRILFHPVHPVCSSVSRFGRDHPSPEVTLGRVAEFGREQPGCRHHEVGDKRVRWVSALLATGLVTWVSGCSGSSSTEATVVPGVLGPGKWGGPSVGLEITSSAATAHFDFCAEGTLTVPILLTPDGRFDVPGTYVRNIGPSIAAKSA